MIMANKIAGPRVRQSPGGTRRHDLDALRAAAMLAGIVLHGAGAFFSWSAAVTVTGAGNGGLYDELYHSIHGFRMPLFFVLSGYFSAMVIRKRGEVHFLKQRAARVLLPLILFGALLIPLIDLIVDRLADPGFVPSSLFTLHHLWFLWLLWNFAFAYAVVGAGVRWLNQRIGSTSDRGPLSILNRRSPSTVASHFTAIRALSIIAILSGTAGTQVVMELTSGQRLIGPEIQTGLLMAKPLVIYYLLFFLVGTLSYRSEAQPGPSYIDHLRLIWKPVLAFTVVVVLPAAFLTTFQPNVSRVLAGLVQGVYAWGMIIGLTGLFGAIFATERRWVRYVSDSSYWLYLIHLPMLFVGHRLVQDWSVPHIVSFSVTLLVTVALGLITYELGVRHSFVGHLLNGRRPLRGEPAPASEALAATRPVRPRAVAASTGVR